MSKGTNPPPQPGAGARYFKRVVKAVVAIYLRLYHRLEVEGLENLPANGPALALTNHNSLMDVPVLMVADPFPNGTMVAKASLFRIPVVREALRAWNSIPVDRDGRDLAGLRSVLGALRQGSVVAIAAEGRRSRSGGHLEPVQPVLARLAVSAGVPIIPVAIVGSHKALPPGAKFPRPVKIVLRLGRPFQLPRGTSEEDAAAEISRRIVAMLPPDQHPLPAPPASVARP